MTMSVRWTATLVVVVFLASVALVLLAQWGRRAPIGASDAARVETGRSEKERDDLERQKEEARTREERDDARRERDKYKAERDEFEAKWKQSDALVKTHEGGRDGFEAKWKGALQLVRTREEERDGARRERDKYKAERDEFEAKWKGSDALIKRREGERDAYAAAAKKANDQLKKIEDTLKNRQGMVVLSNRTRFAVSLKYRWQLYNGTWTAWESPPKSRGFTDDSGRLVSGSEIYFTCTGGILFEIDYDCVPDDDKWTSTKFQISPVLAGKDEQPDFATGRVAYFDYDGQKQTVALYHPAKSQYTLPEIPKE
jgi:hypothetical protein